MFGIGCIFQLHHRGQQWASSLCFLKISLSPLCIKLVATLSLNEQHCIQSAAWNVCRSVVNECVFCSVEVWHMSSDPLGCHRMCFLSGLSQEHSCLPLFCRRSSSHPWQRLFHLHARKLLRIRENGHQRLSVTDSLVKTSSVPPCQVVSPAQVCSISPWMIKWVIEGMSIWRHALTLKLYIILSKCNLYTYFFKPQDEKILVHRPRHRVWTGNPHTGETATESEQIFCSNYKIGIGIYS